MHSFYTKLTMLTYLQDGISSYHKQPDTYLFTAHSVETINGYEFVPGTAIPQF